MLKKTLACAIIKCTFYLIFCQGLVYQRRSTDIVERALRGLGHTVEPSRDAIVSENDETRSEYTAAAYQDSGSRARNVT